MIDRRNIIGWIMVTQGEWLGRRHSVACHRGNGGMGNYNVSGYGLVVRQQGQRYTVETVG